jgi:FkbM family methyltransferase
MDNIYYSQWEQDKWINENIFKNKTKGTFVEVGASDGIIASNTYFFEKLGWRGLCIEPILEKYVELVENRKCIKMNCCVYNKFGQVSFTENKGYTSMISGITEAYDKRHKERLEIENKICGGTSREVQKTCYTLSSLLELNKLFLIDLLSIDTEGSEFEVLQGINFDRFKIRVILVENNYKDTFKKIDDFLVEKGFEHVKTLGGDEVFLQNPTDVSNPFGTVMGTYVTPSGAKVTPSGTTLSGADYATIEAFIRSPET